MSRSLDNIGTRTTPQDRPVPGVTTAENAAGGHGFQIDDWSRLQRFLVLGTDGGTYYASEQNHTYENVGCLQRCIAVDGKRVVDMAVEVSDAGRAPSNDQAIYALAACSGSPDSDVREHALRNLPNVCRIGTHLFHFATFMENHRGWGRMAKAAVSSWYLDKPADRLAHQVAKYRQRDGWSQRDLLRLSRPTPPDAEYDAIFEVATTGALGDRSKLTDDIAILDGFLRAQESQSPSETAKLVNEFGLTREMVKSDHLGSPKVWQSLFDVGMPLGALVRNLGNLTKQGVVKPLSGAEKDVVARLTDEEAIRKSRLHPIAILKALVTYQDGGGFRGKNTWDPSHAVVDALDSAFYLAFGNVDPANKRTLIGLDVSGSMWGAFGGMWDPSSPMGPLSPAQVAAAMSLITMASEPQTTVMAFADEFRPLPISPRMRLESAMEQTRLHNFGRTDCSLPMLYAMEKGLDVDTFMVATDNETWAGKVHPFQALRQYREASGIDAKLVVMGMTATDFSIADPSDPGSLDVVGMDTAAPQLIADFSAGRI